MPTEHFKDVRLHEDWETQIRNVQYEFEEGDIIQVPLDLANKIINFFDVEAEGAGNPYEVLEREADEKIGVRDTRGRARGVKVENSDESEELTAEQVEDEDDYRQLQKYAEQFDDVDGSQSKEDLRDDLLERL